MMICFTVNQREKKQRDIAENKTIASKKDRDTNITQNSFTSYITNRANFSTLGIEVPFLLPTECYLPVLDFWKLVMPLFFYHLYSLVGGEV